MCIKEKHSGFAHYYGYYESYFDTSISDPFYSNLVEITEIKTTT